MHVRPETEAGWRQTTAQSRSQMLLDSLDEGYCTIEMIFDESGEPADYRFIEANAAFHDQTGLQDAVGRRMLAIEPEIDRQWLDI